MPSDRVALQVVDVRPGHRPSELIAAAATATREVAPLDKPDLVMEDRLPWMLVRVSRRVRGEWLIVPRRVCFTGEHGQQARQ